MDRLNILKVIDAWGWAYAILSKEQAKYSSHNIQIKRLADLSAMDAKGFDIIYFSGPNMGKAKSDRLIPEMKRAFPKCKIICAYSGEHDLLYPDCDAIVSISAKWYPVLKKMYAGKKFPVVFMPESVDTEFWTPTEFPDKFTVGWSGRIAEVKRCHLLDKLAFPVVRQSDHGKQFFVENRSLQPMQDFYNAISSLVITSSTEAMPRVALEAMACGRAVVATNVGSLPMVMDSEWLVPVNPEETVVKMINNKLTALNNDVELLRSVGKRNREFIEAYFSWKVNTPLWDLFFWNVANRQNASIEIHNKEYRDQYSKLEPALLT